MNSQGTNWAFKLEMILKYWPKNFLFIIVYFFFSCISSRKVRMIELLVQENLYKENCFIIPIYKHVENGSLWWY